MRNKVIDMLLSELPEYMASWQCYLSDNPDEDRSLCSDLSEIEDYVCDCLKKPKEIDLTGVFAVIEDCLASGDQELASAAATCFLENLLNKASKVKSGIEVHRFVGLLGPKSVEFCRRWDEFTGVKTPGIE